MSHPSHQWVDRIPPAGHEAAPTYTLDREIARARAEMGEEKWARLNAEWSDSEFVFDAFKETRNVR